MKLFVAVFLGCTSTGRMGLCFLWFFVQELPKARLAVVLVLKRLRRRGNSLKSHPTDWEKPGIEPATPGLQDIGLSPTPRRLQHSMNYFYIVWPCSSFSALSFISRHFKKCGVLSFNIPSLQKLRLRGRGHVTRAQNYNVLLKLRKT